MATVNYSTRVEDGTKTAPSYSFRQDTDTGVYRIGANNLGISAGDTKIVDIDSSGLNAIVGATTPASGAFTTGSFSGVASFAAGAVGAPSIGPTGDGNTGWWFPAADTIAASCGGTEVVRFLSTYITSSLTLRAGNFTCVDAGSSVVFSGDQSATSGANILLGGATGSKANLIEFRHNTTVRATFNVSANTMAFTGTVTSNSATAGIGYATGAGGAVTQATGRTTGVTLDKVCGAITLVSAAGSATPASFTVTNSTVAATDVIRLSQKSGTDKYVLLVTAVAAGSFEITAYTTGGTTTEQPVINFAVLKAVAA